jgi:uncharacterized protein YlxP (DUF503 family)
MAGGFVGVLTVDVRIPGAHSLKDKRAPLRSIKQRLRDAGYSVAEVGGQDSWTLSSLLITTATDSEHSAHRLLDEAVRMCERLDVETIPNSKFVRSIEDFGD